MSNVTINQLPTAATIDGAADLLPIYTASAVATQSISRNGLLGITSGPAGLTDTQVLTNKTIGNTNTLTVKDINFTLQDDGDTTKQAKFQLAGITTGTTRTFTLPDVTDSIVTLTATQTLTNKTLTSPTLTSPTLTNATISTDTITGFTVTNTGNIYGISVATGAIQSNTAFADGVILPKALMAGAGSSWAWQSWTPVFTNLTVGNGTLVARYTQIGKTIVSQMSLVFGSTTAVTGSIVYALPVTTSSNYGSSTALGSADLIQTGTASFPAHVFWLSTTTAAIQPMDASTTYAKDATTSSTIPFTWAVSHKLTAVAIYEAA